MAEEFQESEVIFQENDGYEDNEGYNFPRKISKTRRKKLKKTKKITTATNSSAAASVPVNIPENISGKNSWFQCLDTREWLDDDDGDDGEMEPPHVIIGRRIAGKVMAFSVCSGNGRTLKGRDLSEVRNSILRMTGFLET